MSNYIVAITAGTVTTSNGVTDYTFILTMDSVAIEAESIDYQITGVGQSPTSSNDFANNQALTGTVVFAPGETQKTITVSLLNKDKTESNEAFAVSLTSSLGWVTVATNSASVVSMLTDQPKTGGVSLVDNKVYFDVTPTTPYTPTSAADYVKVSGVIGSLNTGNGDDAIITSGGNWIDGGAGNDNITLETGFHSVFGGSGNDTIIISDFVTQGSIIDGGAGTDTIDLSLLQTQNGSLSGVYINLTSKFIELSSSSTIIISGVENFIGSNQDDYISGGKTGNNIDGGAGNDAIVSNAGNDVVNGGAGADALNGGAGYDRLTGGTGNDTFIFKTIKDLGKTDIKLDVITDFTAGEDHIQLYFDANTKVAGTQKFNFIGTSLFTKTAGELRYMYDTNEGLMLQGDTNGDANYDFLIKLLGVTSLQSTDFIYTLV